MATLFNGYSFQQLLLLQHGIIVSGKLLDCEYFLITVLFVKTKEIPVGKIKFFLGSRFFGFLAENILRPRRAWVDQNGKKNRDLHEKFDFCGLLYL